MNPAGTKLFLFEYANREDSLSANISAMDVNGENKRTIIQFPANEVFIDACAADEACLYFAVEVTDPETQEIKKELRQLDTSNGTMATLLTYSNSDWLMGAFNDKLVIVYMDWNTQEYVYTTFSLTTQEQHEFYRYKVEDTSGQGWGIIARCYGDKLYILEPSRDFTAAIYRQDIMTGERELLTTKLPYYNLDGTFVNDFVDNHMLIRITDNRDPTAGIQSYLYALDLSNSKLSEISLKHSDNGSIVQNFATVVGVSDTYYLVNNDTSIKTISIIGNEGVPYTTEIEFPVYSLIKKFDYWNSTPNYLPIEDTIIS